MKNSITTQKNQVNNSSIQMITAVNNLNQFDMIYIYHHIKEGTKLELLLEDIQHLNGDLLYKVVFRGFHLGYVRIRNFMKNELKHLGILTASVFSLSKEKYLPTKSLDIIIEPSLLKLVS